MRGFRDMSFSPRYYVVAANLLLLAAVAYLASSIVGTALAAKLIPPPDVTLKPPPPPIEEREFAARGFALTHKERYLDPWKRAQRLYPGAITTLAEPTLVAMSGKP